jgi:hypothetical protein
MEAIDMLVKNCKTNQTLPNPEKENQLTSLPWVTKDLMHICFG